MQRALRVVGTLLILAIAIGMMHLIWQRYMYSAWTRDGRVRAKVINVSTDVSGIVTEVRVRDNQWVRRGDVLYVLDPKRFEYALDQADVDVARAKAQVQQAQAQLDANRYETTMREARASRREALSADVVSEENRSDFALQAKQSTASFDAAKAAYQVAQANVQAAIVSMHTATLDKERSEVRAPTDGYIVNLNLYPGDFVTAGSARMALVDSNSFWIYAYFEETKIQNVKVGERAKVRLLGGSVDIDGHVDSLASGIVDRDNPTGANDLLANVDPIFTWVRLAQRVPVRVHLDKVPKDVFLAMGMTCTVTLVPDEPKRPATP